MKKTLLFLLSMLLMVTGMQAQRVAQQAKTLQKAPLATTSEVNTRLAQRLSGAHVTLPGLPATPQTRVSLVAPSRAAASTELITTEPQGQKTYVQRYGYIMGYDDNGELQTVETSDVSQIVDADDGTVYMLNPLLCVGTNTWVKGHRDAAGSIIIPGNQPVAQGEMSDGTTMTLYMQHMTLSDAGLTGDGEADIVFTKGDDGVYTANCDGQTQLLGLTTDDGSWVGYADMLQVFEPVEKSDAPATAVFKPYTITYRSAYGEDLNGLVSVAIEGSDIWVKGLSFFGDALTAHGTIADGEALFTTGQFMGVYSTLFGDYPVFLYNGEAVEQVTGSYTLSVDTEEPLRFVYDETERSLTDASGAMLFVSGTSIYDAIINPELVPFEELSAKPRDPNVFNGENEYDAYDPEIGFGAIMFTIDAVDVDGMPLNASELYFNVYYNGNEDTPVTFTTDIYTDLTEDITDVPYGFISGDGGLFTSTFSFFGGQLLMFREDVASIGIQSLYKGGGEANRSAIVWTTLKPETSVDGIEGMNDARQRVETFNLMGQRVGQAARGIVVKRFTTASGHVKTVKTMK